MKLLKIKNIEKNFIIEPGKIYNINIENISYYHKLIFSVLFNDSNLFLYSEDYKEKDILKETLFIENPMNIDPNNKKTLNALYKKIQATMMSSQDKETLELINSKIIELLDQISLNMNVSMDYDTDLDISKILSTYKFCFLNENSNYLERLMIFIKANLEITSFSMIISFNLLPLLEKEKIDLFQKELELLNLTLVNINLVTKIDNSKIDFTTIDDDLCEF